MDEILASLGYSQLKYDDLKPHERETFHMWLQAIEQSEVTVDKIKLFIDSMKYAIEQDLTRHNLSHDEDLYLKARLRNLILISAFLSSPQQAKQQLQQMLGNVTPKG